MSQNYRVRGDVKMWQILQSMIPVSYCRLVKLPPVLCLSGTFNNNITDERSFVLKRETTVFKKIMELNSKLYIQFFIKEN